MGVVATRPSGVPHRLLCVVPCAVQVNLDRPSRALRRAMAGSDDDRVSSSESEESDLDSEDEAARYQQKLEDELDYDFDNRQSRSAQRTLDKAVRAGATKLCWVAILRLTSPPPSLASTVCLCDGSRVTRARASA